MCKALLCFVITGEMIFFYAAECTGSYSALPKPWLSKGE